MCCFLTLYNLPPFLFSLFTGAGLVVLYGIALSLKHVDPIPNWPFIGEIIHKQPESLFFNFFLIWTVICALLTVYFYFLYMRQISCGSQLNKMAFYTGVFSVASFTVSASFPSNYSNVSFYLFCFVGYITFMMYMWLLVTMNNKYAAPNNNCSQFKFTIAITYTVALVLYTIASALHEYHGGSKNFASSTQWILLNLITAFVCSLTRDLSCVVSGETELVLTKDDYVSRSSSVSRYHSSSSSSSSDSDRERRRY